MQIFLYLRDDHMDSAAVDVSLMPKMLSKWSKSKTTEELVLSQLFSLSFCLIEECF